MTAEFTAWLPHDLSPGHLQRTWLYWLLVVLLLAEMLYFQPRSLRFLRHSATAVKPTKGPWGSKPITSSTVIMSIALTSLLSVATFAALLLGSTLAFYTALLGMIPATVRFSDEIPRAHTGETIGAAIGSLIGAALQILLIISIISSVDPTSQFPLRFFQHLDHKAAQ